MLSPSLPLAAIARRRRPPGGNDLRGAQMGGKRVAADPSPGDPAFHEVSGRRQAAPVLFSISANSSAGTGRLNRKPWKSSQPYISRNSCSCASFSTPSATTRSPRLSPWR